VPGGWRIVEYNIPTAFLRQKMESIRRKLAGLREKYYHRKILLLVVVVVAEVVVVLL